MDPNLLPAVIVLLGPATTGPKCHLILESLHWVICPVGWEWTAVTPALPGKRSHPQQRDIRTEWGPCLCRSGTETNGKILLGCVWHYPDPREWVCLCREVYHQRDTIEQTTWVSWNFHKRCFLSYRNKKDCLLQSLYALTKHQLGCGQRQFYPIFKVKHLRETIKR